MLGYVGPNGQWITAADTPAGPVFRLSVVFITGNPTVGSTLTVVSYPSDAAASATYQWLRDGGGIGGETNSTYVVQDADIGMVIACRVSGLVLTTGGMLIGGTPAGGGGGGPPSSAFLLEDGTEFFLEDGTNFLLEA